VSWVGSGSLRVGRRGPTEGKNDMRRIALRRAARQCGWVGIALTLVALAGCGQEGHANRGPSAHAGPNKSEFTRAADHICTAHLETMLEWLRRPHRGNEWQRRAAQDEGTYRIIDNTIQRLEALGSAPGPTATAFADYVKTLKARAALYQLTGMADLQRDNRSVARFQHRVAQINDLGDQDASRYGLHICGANLGDLAKALRPVED
jgi:hypothetical protein